MVPRLRDRVVVAGADLRLSYFRYFDNRVALLDKSPPSSPARTALTSRPCFTHQPAHSPQRKESYLPQWAVHYHGVASGNFLTCYGLRFVELTLPESRRRNHHIGIWCWLTESNRRHPAYKAGALPAELNQQSGSGLCAEGL